MAADEQEFFRRHEEDRFRVGESGEFWLSVFLAHAPRPTQYDS